MGDQRSAAQARGAVAFAALQSEDFTRAAAQLNTALVMAVEVGHLELITHLVMDVGLVAARDQPVHAARLFGAGEALRAEVGIAIWPPRRRLYEQEMEAVREALGEAEFSITWAEGRAMTPERAVEYALHHDATSVDPAPMASVAEGGHQPAASRGA